MKGEVCMSKKIKSPEQVKRIDGRGCFMELLTIGLPRDKIALNFVAYNTAANKGDRVSGSILVYMEIHKAEVFANNVLDGTMTKLGNQSKKYAADHGYKYAKDVFCDLTGTPTDRSTRADKQPISRQLKLTPGSKTAWVLSAESGPGKMEGPGLIAPAYSGGRPECVIRIPLSDDDLKALALSIQAMCRMWYTMKFVPDVEVVDPKTPVFAVQNPDKRLELHTGALAIDQLKVSFVTGSGTMDAYLSVSKAMVLARDIISGRIAKLAKDNPEVYVSYGGGKHGGNILSRQFKVTADGEGFNFEVLIGPGKLSDGGLILPDYETPDKSASVTLSREQLLEFAYTANALSQAWMEQKFGNLVSGPIAESREEAKKQIEGIKASA